MRTGEGRDLRRRKYSRFGHHFQLRVQQGQWPLLKSDCGDDNLLDALITVIFNLNGYNRCVQIFLELVSSYLSLM